MKSRRVLLAALLARVLAGPSHAQVVVFNNLAQGVSGETHFDSLDVRLASDFVTDGEPWMITGLSALMGSSEPDPLTVTFSIFTDNGSGQPGTLVSTFDTPVVVPGDQIGTFSTTSSGISLQPNAPYWLVGQVNEPSLRAVTWLFTSSEATGIGPFTTVAGTQYQRSADNGGSYNGIGGGNFMFALSGDITPVPEPRAGLALLVTVGTFVTFRWWRQR